MFLAQQSTEDTHADLCACRNYHETLRAHGVKSELVLVPARDERCFCLGTPGHAAAAGSPVSKFCNSSWSKCAGFMGERCCIQHTMGFADMVQPLAKFCREAVDQAARTRDK